MNRLQRLLADLVAVEAKMKRSTAELKVRVKARGSRLMDLPGVEPVVAARALASLSVPIFLGPIT